MARWRQLPEGLDPLVVQLVVELRKVKDDSGLSLAQFAGKTGYSASSWDRYLSGRSLPPRPAVEALASAFGADREHLLALHELAGEARQRPARAAGGPGVQPQETPTGAEDEDQLGSDSLEDGAAEAAPPAPVPSVPSVPSVPADAGADRRTGRRWQLPVTAAVAALVGAAVTWLAIWPAQASSTCRTAAPAVAVPQRTLFACHFVQRDGLWYAGNSTTRTRTLVVDMSGPDVAELQCLLQRRGDTPGGIDGNFGPLTEAAVIKAQKALHLDVDGQVGPRTWAALRG